MKASRCVVLLAAVGVAALSYLSTPAAAAEKTECDIAWATYLGALDECNNGDYWACYYVDHGGMEYLFYSCGLW
jgi:hypothetical protein